MKIPKLLYPFKAQSLVTVQSWVQNCQLFQFAPTFIHSSGSMSKTSAGVFANTEILDILIHNADYVRTPSH